MDLGKAGGSLIGPECLQKGRRTWNMIITLDNKAQRAFMISEHSHQDASRLAWRYWSCCLRLVCCLFRYSLML